MARVDWVDYAKGICIFFVVMLHATDLVQNHLDATGWLEQVVLFARPFRMPDFFLVAGLFLASVIDRPWRRYLDRKVVHFLYFYAVWMTLEFLLFDVRHASWDGAGAATGAWGVLGEYLARYVDPSDSLWFIHILPLFFVVTRLLRPVPWWLVWLGGAALQSLQPQTGWEVLDDFAARYVFFFSGYVFATRVFAIARWASAHRGAALGYLLPWGVLNAALVGVGWSRLPVLSLALGYAGALAVILSAVLLARLDWSWPLRYIGEHSIVIYLADGLVSIVMLRVFLPFVADVGTLSLCVTVATLIGAVVLWRLLLRTPARFMYLRPAWCRLEPAAAARAGEPVPGSAALRAASAGPE